MICENCTHEQILHKWISRFPDGSMVPVVILFKNQLTLEEIKAQLTINSTGRFDLEGEVKLIQSYGGIVKPAFISFTNYYPADVPKDKVFAMQDDPRIWSVDPDLPFQTADFPPPNGTQFRYLNGTVKHVPNPHGNSIGIDNSTTNSTHENTLIKDSASINAKNLSSPLKQLKLGILIQDIKCQEGLILVKKATNSVACVKPQTAQKLVERGWGYLIRSDVQQNNSTGELVEAKTDKTIYQYGDTIHLQISDTNYGPEKAISTFKSNYAGIKGPCGTEYFNFAFLKGDYTRIGNYEELVNASNDTLNVVYSTPLELVSCLYTLENYRNATIDSNSNHITIFYGAGNQANKMDGKMITLYNIDHVYGKTTSYKQISKDKTGIYLTSQTIPKGKYTIIAFTLWGEISKPLLISVT